MKILFLGDLHIGARNDSDVFRDMMKDYFDDLFDIINKNDIKYVIQLGDILDKRHGISFLTLNFLNDFFKKFKDENIDFISIAGNHDVYYKNTNELCGLYQISEQYPNINVHIEPSTICFDDVEIKLIPWMNQENTDECLEMIARPSEKPYSLICGHFHLNGFQMHKGMFAKDSDIDNDIFKNADKVLTGHFHTPSKSGKIEYIGTPYKLTWNDYSDDKHIIIFDTETKEYTYVDNKKTLFYKVIYQNGNLDIPELPKKSFVKLIINEPDDLLDTFINRFNEKNHPSQVRLIDVSEQKTNIEELENIQIESTLDVIKKAVDIFDFKNKEYIKNELLSIYQEATSKKE